MTNSFGIKLREIYLPDNITYINENTSFCFAQVYCRKGTETEKELINKGKNYKYY